MELFIEMLTTAQEDVSGPLTPINGCCSVLCTHGCKYLMCATDPPTQKYPVFADPALVRNPLLYAFAKSVLRTGALEVDTHSSVTSMPGAPNQHWHHDTGALFDHDVWPQQKQHPPPHGT